MAPVSQELEPSDNPGRFSNWGGLGARAVKDGVSCLSFLQNVGNHPVEVLESRYPVHIERYEIRADSEGAGRWRGGFGSLKDYRFLVDVELQVPGDRVKIPPFGLFGGQQALATTYLWVPGEQETALETKHAYELQRGDTLNVRTPGGGAAILGCATRVSLQATCAREYVSRGRASSAYGVALDESVQVDVARTSRLRQGGRPELNIENNPGSGRADYSHGARAPANASS